uniref:Uncharacterized protein n=1 Tax=Anguilla anguilla TaxID=7936 RepID=A0A0E9TIU8_ANGAN
MWCVCACVCSRLSRNHVLFKCPSSCKGF